MAKSCQVLAHCDQKLVIVAFPILQTPVSVDYTIACSRNDDTVEPVTTVSILVTSVLISPVTIWVTC